MERDEAVVPLRRPPWLTSWADCRQSGMAHFYRNDLWDPIPRVHPDLDMRRPGYVSVWVGRFPYTQAFELYVREADEDYNLDDGEEDFCPLWDELGFALPHESLRVVNLPRAVSVTELVSGLPSADTFAVNVVAACAAAGVEEGTAALAIYGLDYSGECSLAAGCLWYAGSYVFARAPNRSHGPPT